MGKMGNRNKRKPVEKFKSRKELRKDKRLQKKANRVHFQKRKKELRTEFKEKLKQKNQGKNGKSSGNSKMPPEKQVNEGSDQQKDFVENEHFDDDEEIESDFELSDEELEMKTKTVAKQRFEMFFNNYLNTQILNPKNQIEI